MAGQLPRPWFRLGSITRPTTVTTTAPVTEQSRPAPTLVRPPIIRPATPAAPTVPAEPTTPPQSKSPPPLPRPASLTPPPKQPASPPPTGLTRPVLPLPSNGHRVGSAPSSPPQKAASPVAKPSSPVPFSGSDSKPRSSSVRGSPTNGVSQINNNSTLGAARSSPSPVQSPLVSNSIPALPSPYQSPKPKATASPPSPLVLPPSQLQSVAEPKHESIPQEVERKTVVFQKSMGKPSQPDHYFPSYHTHHNPTFGQNGKQEPLKHDDQGKDKAMRPKKGFGSDKDADTRVITMAGENRGAFMEVVLSDKNNNSRHHQIRQNNNNNETEIEETDNLNNNNSKDNIKSKKKSMGARTNSLPLKAFFNSNVQGINNSILMDSSFTHHDPGIHLVFSRIPLSADQVDQGQQ